VQSITTAAADSKSNSTSRQDRPRAIDGELARSSPPVPSTDVLGERGTLPDSEFLLSSIRSATLRARLVANELDTIGMSLKRNLISVEGAVTWLRAENLLDHVLFRPELLNGSTAV
jgi:hypothetical protein